MPTVTMQQYLDDSFKEISVTDFIKIFKTRKTTLSNKNGPDTEISESTRIQRAAIKFVNKPLIDIDRAKKAEIVTSLLSNEEYLKDQLKLTSEHKTYNEKFTFIMDKVIAQLFVSMLIFNKNSENENKIDEQELKKVLSDYSFIKLINSFISKDIVENQANIGQYVEKFIKVAKYFLDLKSEISGLLFKSYKDPLNIVQLDEKVADNLANEIVFNGSTVLSMKKSLKSPRYERFGKEMPKYRDFLKSVLGMSIYLEKLGAKNVTAHERFTNLKSIVSELLDGDYLKENSAVQNAILECAFNYAYKKPEDIDLNQENFRDELFYNIYGKTNTVVDYLFNNLITKLNFPRNFKMKMLDMYKILNGESFYKKIEDFVDDFLRKSEAQQPATQEQLKASPASTGYKADKSPSKREKGKEKYVPELTADDMTSSGSNLSSDSTYEKQKNVAVASSRLTSLKEQFYSQNPSKSNGASTSGAKKHPSLVRQQGGMLTLTAVRVEGVSPPSSPVMTR